MENMEGMDIIGIDLGGTNIRAGIVSQNKITKTLSCPTPANETKEDVLNAISDLITKLKNDSVSAIGIGVPSVVDVKRGIVYDVMNIPSWKKVYLKDYLENVFCVPVLVNNDANCFAVGEKYVGKGIGFNSVIGMVMGTGLGAGIIVNNKLYEGANCGAGEIGNIPYLNSNYEYYCSGQFFSEEYHISAKDAYQNAMNGDPKSIEMFKILGKHVGNMIQTALYAYDPEIIVFGGSLSKSFPLFQADMYKSFEKFAYPKTISQLKIEVSDVENIAIYGAASLHYNNL